MARPRKEIDQRSFEQLCGLQCTEQEICDFFDVTDKTLNSWCQRIYQKSFSECFRIKRGLGKISLRRKQFQLADKNPSMAIWLGKQWLGQRDTVEAQIQTTSAIQTIALQLLNEKKEDTDNETK